MLLPAQFRSAYMFRTTTHERIFCSFCGKSKDEVRSLIEGGCRNPALSQCVFICDECVDFSAQVLADLGVLGVARRAS
jgi:hypothetical protein